MSFVKKNIHTLIILVSSLIFLTFCFPFVTWLVFAAIIAFSLKPIQNKILIKKYKINKTFSVYLILSALFMLLVPFILSFLSFFSEGKTIATELRKSESIQSIDNFVDKVYEKAPFLNKVASQDKTEKYLKKGFDKSVNPLLDFISNFFLSLPMFFLGLFFFSASLFYFIADSNLFYNFIKNLNFIDVIELNNLVKIIQKACQSTLYAAFATGFVQSLIIAIASVIVGLNFFFSIFFITFFFAQIPLIGTFPIALGLFGYSYYNDDTTGLIAVIVCGVIAGVSDNIIRAWFLNKYDSLHPLAGLISTIGSIIILGPIGVLIGPVITLVLIGLLDQESKVKS